MICPTCRHTFTTQGTPDRTTITVCPNCADVLTHNSLDQPAPVGRWSPIRDMPDVVAARFAAITGPSRMEMIVAGSNIVLEHVRGTR